MTMTIKDMSKILNVSPSTISRVLSTKKGASKETMKRIFELARLVNYKPNPVAQRLVLKKTNIINIIIPQTSELVFSNPFYTEILKGIGSGAKHRKYYLIISLFQEMTPQEFDTFHLASGVLVLSNRIADEQVLKESFSGVPTVAIPGFLTESDFSTADFDNLYGAMVATGHLLDLGHTRVAYISGPRGAKHSILRERGFREAFQKQNLFLDETLVVEGDFSEESGARCMKELLDHSCPPTAILCVNDITAIGALWQVRRFGLSVPRDLSIVGFGDIPLVGLLDPPLTTVREPFIDLGNRAVNLLIDLIEGKKTQQENIVLPVEFVIRGTTAPPI